MPDGGVELIRDRFQAVLSADHPFSSLQEVELPELIKDPLIVSSSVCELSGPPSHHNAVQYLVAAPKVWVLNQVGIEVAAVNA